MSTAQLLRIGLSTWQIRRLVATGSLIRLRQGWLAEPNANSDVRRAVEKGGALSCIAALKLHRLWTPPFNGLHLRRSNHHRQATHDCRPHGPELPVHRSVDPLGVALLAAARCLPPFDAVVLLDSALNLRKVSESDLVDLFADQPQSAKNLLRLIDKAESGTETYIRLRLRRRRIKLRPQVRIAGVGRVDFLVGERLVIESDSRAHHDNPEAYSSDRLRDARLGTMGFHVLRLRYEDVMTPRLWASAEADLLARLRRRDHYWPRRRKSH